MSLGQLNFDGQDMVDVAIARLKEFEPSIGYELAFSGGKDSVVIYWLAERAGVKFKAHFNDTTVEAPELYQFIKEYYPGIQWNKPEVGMFKLIASKGMPPTRMQRYCCEILKEHGGSEGAVIITGIRWAESAKRKKRMLVESCFKGKSRKFVNPILDWSDKEVWELIHGEGIPYCKLYDEGWKRIGCVGCPMGSRQKEELERWPKYKNAYRKAIEQAFHNRVKHKGEFDKWKTPDELWEWWINGGDKKADPDQTVMFE